MITRPKETLIGIAIVFLGVPFYLYWHWQLKRKPKEIGEFDWGAIPRL